MFCSSKVTSLWQTSIILSSKKPMAPMKNTAIIIWAVLWVSPFWYMSHTNFPSPWFWAIMSEATSTIQPTPIDNLKPVKIRGRDDGRTIFQILLNHPSFKTFATLRWSLSTDATPTAVLISVGHIEHKVTTPAEVHKARCQILVDSGCSIPHVVNTKTIGYSVS